jgi:hypothetical protein
MVFAVAAAVLALSAASSADAATARSFSISASASASLDASESHSVAATTAAVSQRWHGLPWTGGQPQGMPANVSLATAPATATRATTSCISSWACSALSWRTSWARFRPEDSRVYIQQNRNNWHSSRRSWNQKRILDKKTHRGRGEDELVKVPARPSHSTLQGVARRSLLVVLGVGVKPGGSCP